MTDGKYSWKLKLACVWGGELVSVLTSSILQMGFVWHITLTTNSASMLSLASLAGFLPLALFGTFAGTIVDRLSLRVTLIGADLFIAAVSAACAVVSLSGRAPRVGGHGGALRAAIRQRPAHARLPGAHAARGAGRAPHAPRWRDAGRPVRRLHPRHGGRSGDLPALGAHGDDRARRGRGRLWPRWRCWRRGSTWAARAVRRASGASASRAQARALAAETADGYRVLRGYRGLFALLWCGFAFTLVFSPHLGALPLMTPRPLWRHHRDAGHGGDRVLGGHDRGLGAAHGDGRLQEPCAYRRGSHGALRRGHGSWRGCSAWAGSSRFLP